MARGLQRVLRDADDDGALPIWQAGEVTGISGVDGRLVEAGGGEDIKAGVAMAE